MLKIDTTTAGREFVRRFQNVLPELQLTQGIHRRIELLTDRFAEEHPNVRACLVSREVDDSYVDAGAVPHEAASRPRLQALAIDGDRLYEFLAFAHGFRAEATPLDALVNVQELWLEPEPGKPFVYRATLSYDFQAATVILASTGETQDAATAFVERLKYLRGW